MDVDLIAGCSLATKLETTDQIMNEIIFQFLPVFWPKFPRSVRIKCLNNEKQSLICSVKVQGKYQLF